MKKSIIAALVLVLLSGNDLFSQEDQTHKGKPPVQREKVQSPPRKAPPSTQKKQKPKQKPAVKQEEKQNTAELPLFPDEYTVLDDFTQLNHDENEVILRTLEHARQKYLQALIWVEKGDTTGASKYFEKSIEILNRITSYPGIENNKDYIDLAQSVIDDYENFIQSIENLDDNSPFFVVRNKLFIEVDAYTEIPQPNLKRIIMPKDSGNTLIGEKTVVEEPKEIQIPLLENEVVLKNISFLTSEGKKGGKRFYQKWLERTTKWFPMMRRIAAEEDAPEELIYLSMIESGLRPDAVSSAKAVGLWQFIRSTGEIYGLNDTPSVWIDERRDPEKSTRAAIKHLKDLYTRFGDWHLALAAYNCGAGRVSRTKLRYGDTNSGFWDIMDKLPRETRHYVPIYIASTKIALNPEAYGFEVDSLDYEDEFLYDSYVIKEPLSLSVIAKCVDTTREAIQALNPELLRSITPPDMESYPIKLPVGTVEKFVGKYSTLTPEEKQPWVEHTVARGESISKLARTYGISKQEIADANDLPSYRSRLKRGAVIKIPIDKDYFAEKKKQEEEDAKYRPKNTNYAAKNSGAVYHTVRRGESLYSIAGKYGIRMAALRNLNNIPYDDDNIQIGQKLVISVDKNASKNTNVATTSGNKKLIRHKVKSGENLHSIAENYNVSIGTIKSVNNLKSDKILVGQMLVIEAPKGSGNVAAKVSGDKTTHTVKKGETLSTIAGRYGVSESDLKKWNPRDIKGETVYLGTTLVVHEPHAQKGSAKAASDNVNNAPKYYTVQSGETLSSIARKFGVSLGSLKKRNTNINPDRLKAGQKIRIQ